LRLFEGFPAVIIEKKYLYFAWDCVAECARALVLGRSHFNDVGSSSTTARVQVSAEYVTFFQFLLRWSAHFTPQFYIFMSTEDIYSGLHFFDTPYPTREEVNEILRI
jgi:hypothetical protein